MQSIRSQVQIKVGIWIEGGGKSGAVIAVNGKTITIDMSAFNRPFANGFIIDDDTITVTFPDTSPGTFTGKLKPNKILWSNDTVWRKV